jgi:hypothetical protein
MHALRTFQTLSNAQAVDADEADWRQQEAETLKAKEEERLVQEAKVRRIVRTPAETQSNGRTGSTPARGAAICGRSTAAQRRSKA